MSLLPKKLYQGQLTTSQAALYTASGTAGHFTIVRSIIAVNTDSQARMLLLCAVPSGGTAGAANMLLDNVSVPAGSTLTFDLVVVLNASEFISAKCDAGAVMTVTISGVEGP